MSSRQSLAERQSDCSVHCVRASNRACGTARATLGRAAQTPPGGQAPASEDTAGKGHNGVQGATLTPHLHLQEAAARAAQQRWRCRTGSVLP